MRCVKNTIVVSAVDDTRSGKQPIGNAGVCMVDQYLALNPLTMGDNAMKARSMARRRAALDALNRRNEDERT